jgi:hypothetical protein
VNETEAGRSKRVATGKPLYRETFSLRWLRAIAIASLTLSLLLVAFGMLDPIRFENDTARFMLCLAIATLLAIFWFVFYPERVELALPLPIGTAIRFGGPIAIWFAVFIFLLMNVPSAPYGRLFEIWKNGQPGGMYLTDRKNTFFTIANGVTPPNYSLVASDDGSNTLKGIYVEFPRNVQRIDAELNHTGWTKPIPVTLKRTGLRCWIFQKLKKEYLDEAGIDYCFGACG